MRLALALFTFLTSFAFLTDAQAGNSVDHWKSVMKVLKGASLGPSQGRTLPRLNGTNPGYLQHWGGAVQTVNVLHGFGENIAGTRTVGFVRHEKNGNAITQWAHAGGPIFSNLDPNGYPRTLGLDEAAGLVALNGLQGYYPPGAYTVCFEGRGTISVEWDTPTQLFTQSGSQFRVNSPTNAGIHVSIVDTTPSDHVRNLRVNLPGHSCSSTTYWNPDFINYMATHTNSIRDLDISGVNDQIAPRTPIDMARNAQAFHYPEVPIEHRIDRCNQIYRASLRLNPGGSLKGCWFTLWTDFELTRHYANEIFRLLDPNLIAFVEFSNEVWNPMFPIRAYTADLGNLLFPGGPEPFHQAWALQAGLLFYQFKGVFASAPHRLATVFAGQAANPWQFGTAMRFFGLPNLTDVGSYAPYFECEQSLVTRVARQGSAIPAYFQYFDPNLTSLSNAALKQRCSQDIATNTARVVSEHNQMISGVGISTTYLYESGQHLAATYLPCCRVAPDTRNCEISQCPGPSCNCSVCEWSQTGNACEAEHQAWGRRVRNFNETPEMAYVYLEDYLPLLRANTDGNHNYAEFYKPSDTFGSWGLSQLMYRRIYQPELEYKSLAVDLFFLPSGGRW